MLLQLIFCKGERTNPGRSERPVAIFFHGMLGKALLQKNKKSVYLQTAGIFVGAHTTFRGSAGGLDSIPNGSVTKIILNYCGHIIQIQWRKMMKVFGLPKLRCCKSMGNLHHQSSGYSAYDLGTH